MTISERDAEPTAATETPDKGPNGQPSESVFGRTRGAKSGPEEDTGDEPSGDTRDLDRAEEAGREGGRR